MGLRYFGAIGGLLLSVSIWLGTVSIWLGTVSILQGTAQAQDHTDATVTKQGSRRALVSVPQLQSMLLKQQNVKVVDVGPNREEYDQGPVSYTHLTLPTIYPV